MNRIGQKESGALAFLVAVVVPLGVYLTTLAPAVYFGDSGEFNTASFSLGIAHVPGYPLYCLLGKLFTFLPLGGISFRLNLMSAVFSALSIGLAFGLFKQLTGDRRAALIAVLALAFTFTLWEQSLKSRAYPLNLFFGLAIIWAAVSWRQTGRSGFLYLASFLFGLGLGNHEILLITVFPLAALMIAERKSLSLGNLATCVFLLAAGLSVYLYLPVRSAVDPALDWGDPQSLGRLIEVLLQKQYSHKILNPDLEPKIRMTGLIFRSFLTEFTVAPLVAGLFGLLALLQRFRVLLVGLLLMIAANIFLRVNYIGDFEFHQIYRYLINSYLVLALGLAFGLAALFTWLNGRVRRSVMTFSVVLLGAALIGSPLMAHYRSNDLSRHWLARDYARSLMQYPQQDALLFVGGDNDIYPIWDLQTLSRYRPDITALGQPGFFADWLREKWGGRSDPAFFTEPTGLPEYNGPDRYFYRFFANAVNSGRFPVLAMYNDDEDPVAAERWALFRDLYDWRPYGLSIAFKPKDGRPFAGIGNKSFDWNSIPTDCLNDPDLVRDAHTKEILEVYAGIFLKHGLLALSEKRPLDALEFFQLSLTAQPDDFEAAANVAGVLASLGQLDEAIKLLGRLTSDPRADWKIWVNLGRVNLAMGDRNGALAALKTAEGLVPEDDRVQFEQIKAGMEASLEIKRGSSID